MRRTASALAFVGVVAVVAFVTLALVLAPTLLGGGRAGAQSAGVGMFSGRNFDSTSGVEIYHRICQGCHMPDGKGAIGAGHYPALAGDAALASTQFMAVTLLGGRRNMPAFGGEADVGLFFAVPTLDDEQIAAVINYVRTSFGNHFKGRITATQVRALRPAHHDTLTPAH